MIVIDARGQMLIVETRAPVLFRGGKNVENDRLQILNSVRRRSRLEKMSRHGRLQLIGWMVVRLIRFC